MGICVPGSSSFSFSSSQSSAWTGAGILNKPIGDFFAGTYNRTSGAFSQVSYFVANSLNSLQVTINSAIIPEPEEYALIFGLFALGFCFLSPPNAKETTPKIILIIDIAFPADKLNA